MNTKFQVSKFTNLSPKWWLNFLQSLPLTANNFHPLINENLKKWNAVYLDCCSVETPTVVFDTEKDATMFILRWSS